MKEQPGVFIRHEACPVCGSNDNRAIYDNGNKFTYFCFGCEHEFNTGPAFADPTIRSSFKFMINSPKLHLA